MIGRTNSDAASGVQELIADEREAGECKKTKVLEFGIVCHVRYFRRRDFPYCSCSMLRETPCSITVGNIWSWVYGTTSTRHNEDF